MGVARVDKSKILDEAIGFAADRWQSSVASGTVPANINLRDQVTLFTKPFLRSLFAKFPALRPANDQVLLLVIAEGIARSDTISREKIETALGIVLPPT